MKKIALYNPYLETKGGGERVCLALADSLVHNLDSQVSLIVHKKTNLEKLSDYFAIDLSGIKLDIIQLDTPLLRLVRKLPLPGRVKNIATDLKISRHIKKQGYDIFINNCYQSNLPSPCKTGIYMCMFPQNLNRASKNASLLKRAYYPLASLLARIILHPGHKSAIDTYTLITANSKYTQSYIKKMWNKKSEILYPQCESMSGSRTGKKERVILNIGRFFENSGENHHKKQDVLLREFAKMTDLHMDGWQLHFVGSVAEDVGALKYILSLIEGAKGLPVFFHFNCSFKEIVDLYNRSSIYWHATGYGSNPRLHPEKQEHFGISTVEAMSTGSIPVVINSAGQKEVVTHGVNGYLWDSPDQLRSLTSKLVAEMGTDAFEKMQSNAISRSRDFDTTAFRNNVADIFSKFL